MFLSSTDQSPSNNSSSSSSSFLHLTNSSDELGQSRLSTFSIRDYAFSYRTKNIKKNWPFSPTSLQLCLKYGLSDPLPPIHQPLGSLISHAPEASSLKQPNITHLESISYKRKSEKLGSNQTLPEATKQGFENVLLASGSKSKIKVAIVNKNPRKKYGVMVKSGACVDSGSKEDNSCLFSASESMAVRTCPICKTFSFASNTTLNAHMDQCLSIDSGLQPTSKPNRPRTKPRLKVKLMIDIYAASKGCTLEDLDKRNGTKWAVISSYSNRVVSDKPEVSSKGKKRSVLRLDTDKDAAGIGPVYIDSKGQKLRILSEFSEKASDPSREPADVNEKKSSSEGKGDKSSRKRLRGDKYYKYRKLVPQTRKLTVSKGNASEITEHPRGYSKEGKDFVRSETSGPGQRRIFNQRMLTKHRHSRNGNKKATSNCNQPADNGQSLSEDHLVLRGPRHVSTDLSEIVSSSSNSQNSWKVCGESQASGRSWDLSRKKSIETDSFLVNPLRCSTRVENVFSSEANGVTNLNKAQLDISETEDEDTGKWESEITQERELRDYDDWDDTGETDKVTLSSNPSVSGEEDDYESYDETGNNKEDDDMLDKMDDADAEFEIMMYEKTGCETVEQGSSFMEVDPIPIPGPPGSFLPSPWDTGTDAVENHGNSSVIASQVQSSQDHLDLTDRNSSESHVSAISNFAAPESHTLSLHNIIITDKRPSRFIDNDQSFCCQRKEKAFEGTTFDKPRLYMIQQDSNIVSKSVPATPSNPNPVLRLMGKDLMVINQTEESKPTSPFLDISKTQQEPPSDNHLHRPYGGNSLFFDASTSFYKIP